MGLIRFAYLSWQSWKTSNSSLLSQFHSTFLWLYMGDIGLVVHLFTLVQFVGLRALFSLSIHPTWNQIQRKNWRPSFHNLQNNPSSPLPLYVYVSDNWQLHVPCPHAFLFVLVVLRISCKPRNHSRH